MAKIRGELKWLTVFACVFVLDCNFHMSNGNVQDDTELVFLNTDSKTALDDSITESQETNHQVIGVSENYSEVTMESEIYIEGTPESENDSEDTMDSENYSKRTSESENYSKATMEYETNIEGTPNSENYREDTIESDYYIEDTAESEKCCECTIESSNAKHQVKGCTECHSEDTVESPENNRNAITDSQETNKQVKVTSENCIKDTLDSHEINYRVTGNGDTFYDKTEDAKYSVQETTSTANVTNPQNEMNKSEAAGPIVELHHTIQTVGVFPDTRDVPSNVIYVRDPVQTFSVYEPYEEGTCQKGHYRAATVLETAENRRCVLAVNAGFFNTDTGECYGNIVSDGRLVQNTTADINDVHFGIMRNGSLFVGYITDVSTIADDFLQLVGGVVWVLKDGEVNVDESIRTDYNSTQTTGTLEEFALFVAARTLVGHASDGRVMILQVDGINENQGVTLYDAARIMKKYGAINAINLDGGGSTTLVVNHTLVSFPSDICKNNTNFHCVRKVTTVLCVHEPLKGIPDSVGHGSCDLGQGRCHGYEIGKSCDVLKHSKECPDHGECTKIDQETKENRRKNAQIHKEMSREHRSASTTEVILATIIFLSVTLNLGFIWKYYTNSKHVNKTIN